MMRIQTVSALEKVLPRADVRLPESSGVCLSGARYAFQVVVRTERPVRRCRLTWQSPVPVLLRAETYTTALFTCNAWHDDYIIGEGEAIFPDALLPYASEEFSLAAGVNHTFWVTVPAGTLSGTHDLVFCTENAEDAEDACECRYTLTVLSGEPAESDLIVTKWIHSDCIAEACGVAPFEEAFYTAFGNYVRAAVRSGQTMAYIPMFTPPLDTAVGGERLTVQSVGVTETGDGYRFDFTRFDRLIVICREAGIRYFELSHLFTQWGAEKCPKIMVTRPDGSEYRRFGWDTPSDGEDYTAFLAAFLPVLADHVRELGIFDVTYLHLSDEPSGAHLERYICLYETVKRYAGGLPTMDALSNFAFAERGVPDLPVVEAGHVKPFVEHQVPCLLYYACTTDRNNLPNIFINMPHLRVRVLGIALYMTGAKGFLHWGFNFYHTALSLRRIDPYRSCDGGETFPAGDPFVVYPDGGLGVYSSVRNEIFALAMQDYRLLITAERRLGREGVLALLRRHGFRALTDYTRAESDFDALQQELVAAIAEAGARGTDERNACKTESDLLD